MKKLFKLLLIIFVLPLGMYEGYYQFIQFKNNYWSGNTKSSSSNIRHVDRGFYWNYPYNEKFIAYNEDGEEVVIQTDALGFRNPEVKDEYDVLLLGDSYTSAANTKYELTFASHLNKAGISIYNAGIEGTGTIHQAHILDDVLEKIKPKLVVLNFYLGNDFRDNFYCPDIQNVQALNNQTKNTETQTAKIADKAIDKTVEGKQKSLPWLVTLKAKLHPLIDYSGAVKLFYNLVYLPAKYQGTDMSYYDRGELMIMAHNRENSHPDTIKAIQKTEDALIYIKKTLEAKNIPLLVVGIPSKAQVLKSVREISNYDTDKKGAEFFSSVKKDIDFDRPDRILAVLCSEQHIPYVSLLRPFRQQFEKKLYYHFDSHWTYIGQEVGATTVLPQIKELLKTTITTPLLAPAPMNLQHSIASQKEVF